MKSIKNTTNYTNANTDATRLLNSHAYYTHNTYPNYPTQIDSSIDKPNDTAYEISPSNENVDTYCLTTSNIENKPTHFLDTSLCKLTSSYNNYNNNSINKIKPTISNSNLPHTNNNINNNKIIEKLKQKISSQAKRLTELQVYKALCEKHILQLVPNHTLPITEEDITNYNIYLTDNSGDRDKNIALLVNEKGNITETLRKETILNEQLRKYNELLKGTIDSILLKNNLDSLLQNSFMFSNIDNKKYSDKYDYVINVNNILNEYDKKEKELIVKDNIIKSLETELTTLKKELNDYENKFNSLFDKSNKQNLNYNIVLQEKNELDYKIKDLIEEINNEKNKKRIQQESSISEKKQFEYAIGTLRKELEDIYSKNKDLITIQSNLKLENTDLLNQLNKNQTELKQIQLILKNKDTDIHHLNKQITSLQNTLTSLTHEKEDLIQTKEKLDKEKQELYTSIHELNEIRSHNENKIQTLSDYNKKNTNEINSLQVQYQQDIKNKNDHCVKLQNEISLLKENINNLNNQLKQTIINNVKQKDAISEANERENKLRNELTNVVNNNKTLVSSYEKNIHSLKQEIQNSANNINKNNELVVKVGKLSFENKRLLKSNSELEEMNKCLIKEIEQIRKLMKENEIKNYTMFTNRNANVKIIENCFLIINEYINKYTIEKHKGNLKMYLDAFFEFEEWFRNNKSIISNEDNYKLTVIEMFISMISNQTEIFLNLYEATH